MNKITMLIVVVSGALSLTACGPMSPPATKPAGPSLPVSAVTGTVTYLVRSALPPTAVIEVVLQDVSKADAPAETISSQSIEANGKQVPFPYVLKYDSAKIDPKNTYAVRATIKNGDQLLFTRMTLSAVDVSVGEIMQWTAARDATNGMRPYGQRWTPVDGAAPDS